MKLILLFLCLTSCSKDDVPLVWDIHYFKDDRTNICFACPGYSEYYRTGTFQTNRCFSPTAVVCSPEVERLLNK